MHDEGEALIRHLAAVMFTDMVGYTALMQSDEAAALRNRAKHRQALTQTTSDHGGRVLQYFGDGSLSLFQSSVGAVMAAIEIQHALGRDPLVRIGLHLGDVAYDEQGAYGDAINIAARLEALAPPGGVLISRKVFDEIQSRPELPATHVADMRLKNVRGAVGTYSLVIDGVEPVVPPAGDVIADMPSEGGLPPLVQFRLDERAKPLPTRGSSPGGTPDHTPFIGREEEMETIHQLVDEVESGRGRTLFVRGPRGVGKTRIAEETAAAQGVALTGTGVAQFAVAANGTVAYMPEEPRSLVLVDRAGNHRPATSEFRNFHAPMFSPDGGRVSTDFNAADGRDVWVLSLSDGVLSRATFDRDGHDATWAPDGESIFYTSTPNGVLGTFRTRPGSGDVEALFSSERLGYTGIWVESDSALVTTGNSLEPGSNGDIGIIRNGGRGPIEALVATRFEEQFPAVSPNEVWLAYSSRKSGPYEVYVRRLAGGDPIQVSSAGGIEPVWGPDGRELFYRSAAGGGSQMVVAEVDAQQSFSVTSRQSLFSVGDIATATPHSNYDISPDGQTFVMVRFNPSSRIEVIQNLPALVQKMRESAGR